MAASREVMHADTITLGEMLNVSANFLHYTGNFMSEGERQRFHRRNSRAVMSIGMTNPCRADSNQHIACTDIRDRNIPRLKR